MKKILLLGGDFLLLPVIRIAKEYGCYVITCDYLPDNIAHKYSDEYINYSTTDKEEILSWSWKNHVDAIVTFTDSGAVTAAYIAENLGIPYQCSYNVATILQDKALFRAFLKENGFNCPNAKGYSSVDEALSESESYSWPVIVKPVDSAGSKGVSKVDDPIDLKLAIDNALQFSNKRQFIIEDYLEKDGFSCGSEVFVLDGKVVFNGVYDQYFDLKANNPYIPSAEVWPSSLSSGHLSEFRNELQKLVTLLDVRTGIFNVEFRLCKDGKLYLMEVSPRAGGNRLAEMLCKATGVNIIDAEVRKAIGLPVTDIHDAKYKKHYAIYVLHSIEGGVFQDVEIDAVFEKEHVIEKMITKQRGDTVNSFRGANAAIGTVFLQFDSREQLAHSLDNTAEWLKINVK